MIHHGPLRVIVSVQPDFQQNALLFWPEGHSGAWILDPGLDPQAQHLLAALAQERLTAEALILTHTHVDHIAGVNTLRAALPNVPLFAPRDEVAMLADPWANLSAGLATPVVVEPPERLLAPGEHLQLGSLQWQVLDVSGHSPGGLAFYCAAAGVVAVGDALFAGSVGRTDFPGSSSTRLLGNIRTQLLSLPAETVVYSGHGPTTTIGEERDRNPFLTTGGQLG
ncbi:MAG: MBL fold metallo-hydrolase [Phycisphaerales bacterium]|nr:MBL fold metallo-hydrolase [Phycisphaerales bacterium]